LFSVKESAIKTAQIANVNRGTFEEKLTVLTRNGLVAFGSGESNLAISRSAKFRGTVAPKTKTVSLMGSSKNRQPNISSHEIPPRIEA
jgi:hypothetical protein